MEHGDARQPIVGGSVGRFLIGLLEDREELRFGRVELARAIEILRVVELLGDPAEGRGGRPLRAAPATCPTGGCAAAGNGSSAGLAEVAAGAVRVVLAALAEAPALAAPPKLVELP